MAILNVPVTTNFSAQNLLNIDTINMSGSSILATFSSTQFGAGKISTSVAINNSGNFDRIIVNMAAAGTFSAAGWTYLAPFDSNDGVVINGTTGVDTIIGSSGRDSIGTDGGNPVAGADHLFGGDGDDILSPSSGVMTGAIYDGGAGSSDLLSLKAPSSVYDLRTASIVGMEILNVGSAGISAFLDNDQVGAGKLNRLIYTGPPGVLPTLAITGGNVDLSTFIVAPTQVASITITGDPILASTLIGSGLADRITGGNGADTLAGNAGADTLFGGRGNDTFLFDTTNQPNSGDIVNGGQGFADQVLLNTNTTFDLSLLTITDVEKLQFGAAGATAFILGSQLLGVSDISQVTGGAGIDQLNITANVINLTTLALGSWTDGVDILKIIGSAATDTLTGSTGGDTFDVADLTVSVDSVVGGIGNDIYRVDQIDLIGEAAGQGTADRVQVLSTYVLGAAPDIEFLETADALGITAIDLTGNALVQTITGNNGANRLDSGGGVDTLIGLSGNDVYFVRTLGTVITEIVGQGGLDIVRSAVSFALAAANDIEQMSTTVNTGTTAINLTGNAAVQIISGNAGANRLDGRGGSDKLNGLAGADTFVFSTALGATNVDTVSDYAVIDDKIELKSSMFTGLLNGALDPTAFAINATGLAGDASDRVIYKSDTGFLFFDADGLGGAAGIKFAVLSAGLAMVSTEFVVA